MQKPKFNDKAKEKAARAQSKDFIGRYYFQWRLAKVLTNQNILNNRFEFYQGFPKSISKPYDSSNEKTIAHEIKHGLYFDSIAQCVQYVEDIFAFINAMENPIWFIKKLISYKSGTITNSIKNFKITPSNVENVFFLPGIHKMENEEYKCTYKLGLNNLMNWLKEILTFYNTYHFFYNQYKHGLAVGMHPFQGILTDLDVQLEKNRTIQPHLVVYDSIQLEKSKRDEQFKISIPNYPEVYQFREQLDKENNLMKGILITDPNFNMEYLVEIAQKACICLGTLLSNFDYHFVKKCENFNLPKDKQSGEAFNFKFSNNEFENNP